MSTPTPTTAMMFRDSEGAPIRCGETLVQPTYEFKIAPSQQGKLSIVLEPGVELPEQGVQLMADGVKMFVDGTATKALLIWSSDTTPDAAFVDYKTSRRAGVIRLLNVWRDERNERTYGRGNCGVVVRRGP